MDGGMDGWMIHVCTYIHKLVRVRRVCVCVCVCVCVGVCET